MGRQVAAERRKITFVNRLWTIAISLFLLLSIDHHLQVIIVVSRRVLTSTCVKFTASLFVCKHSKKNTTTAEDSLCKERRDEMGVSWKILDYRCFVSSHNQMWHTQQRSDFLSVFCFRILAMIIDTNNFTRIAFSRDQVKFFFWAKQKEKRLKQFKCREKLITLERFYVISGTRDLDGIWESKQQNWMLHWRTKRLKLKFHFPKSFRVSFLNWFELWT